MACFYSGDDWPSLAELAEGGTRVVLAGLEPSTLIFSITNDVNEEIFAPSEIDSTCDGVADAPEPSWQRVQGDMVEYKLYRENATLLEHVPSEEDALTGETAAEAMACGLTPTFDRLDAELMESTIWSWSTDRPETGFALPRAAVIMSDSDGRWEDVGSDHELEQETHSYACREKDNRREWEVVAIEYSNYIGKFEEADGACQSLGAEFTFGAPRTAYENQQLLGAMDEAGVSTAWLDYTSQGDDSGDSACWTREDEGTYCVAAFASNDSCSAASSAAEYVADGQLPSIFLVDWEVDNYTRPNYSTTPTVENLHSWVRVAGENEFDLEDRGYVVGENQFDLEGGRVYGEELWREGGGGGWGVAGGNQFGLDDRRYDEGVVEEGKEGRMRWGAGKRLGRGAGKRKNQGSGKGDEGEAGDSQFDLEDRDYGEGVVERGREKTGEGGASERGREGVGGVGWGGGREGVGEGGRERGWKGVREAGKEGAGVEGWERASEAERGEGGVGGEDGSRSWGGWDISRLEAESTTPTGAASSAPSVPRGKVQAGRLLGLGHAASGGHGHSSYCDRVSWRGRTTSKRRVGGGARRGREAVGKRRSDGWGGGGGGGGRGTGGIGGGGEVGEEWVLEGGGGGRLRKGRERRGRGGGGVRGGAAIFGVRSLDADIVSLWGSLESMGQDMIVAQNTVNSTYTTMERMENKWPRVAECSNNSFLKDAVDGITSAKNMVVDGNIGSVGRGIESVNEEISRTTGTRRGVVYCTAGFVLLMSIVYVLVGYYALQKGRGKAAAARVRG
eukprot:jgi/Undpi1/12310/HiC_scaffold_5.g01986.m1